MGFNNLINWLIGARRVEIGTAIQLNSTVYEDIMQHVAGSKGVIIFVKPYYSLAIYYKSTRFHIPRFIMLRFSALSHRRNCSIEYISTRRKNIRNVCRECTFWISVSAVNRLSIKIAKLIKSNSQHMGCLVPAYLINHTMSDFSRLCMRQGVLCSIPVCFRELRLGLAAVDPTIRSKETFFVPIPDESCSKTLY